MADGSDDECIIISDEEGTGLPIMNSVTSGCPARNGTDSIDTPIGDRRQQIESQISGSVYARNATIQGSSSTQQRQNALPRQFNVISVQSDHGEERQNELNSVIVVGATSSAESGAQNEAIYLSESPPKPESANTTINDDHSSLRTILPVQSVEEKRSTSSEPQQRRTNSKPITLVAYTGNSIPSQSMTNAYRGDIDTRQPTDSDRATTGQNTQRNTATHLEIVKHDIVQLNAQPAVITHITAAACGSSAPFTPAPLQPTTKMQVNDGSTQCQIILESPPPIVHTRPTVTNQGSGSDIETIQSSSNQNNHVGSDHESSQQTTSQSKPRLVTVNADILDQVVKLAAFCCRTLQPHGETAEQHESNFHRLLTSIEEFQREPIVAISSTASSVQSSFSMCESHSVSENEVICIGDDDSPRAPNSTQQAARDASLESILLPSHPEKSIVHTNTPMQPSSQLNQQSSASTPPPTRASGMEQSISLTSKNGLSTCKESSFDSTLTEGTLEDSFNDECETPVPSQSAQSRNPFRRESDEILECGEPPRKRVKMTFVNLDEDRGAQPSGYRQGRVSNEAMDATVTVVDDQQETLLPTAAQSGRK